MNTSARMSPLVPPEGRVQEIEDLLKNLVGKLGSSIEENPNDDEAGQSEQVILDLHVGEIRCLFIKKTTTDDRARITISPRERTIASMVAAGHPNKAIAHVLRISTWTVSTHLRRIFAKLGVTSRAAMVAHLMETGVLKAPAAKQWSVLR